ncbi:tyrosine-protein phosphatase non-receptor type 6 [Colletotrichum tofieldiae]|uniref:Tyrosine-protein phosphatase non-receptor type 6 n=1 Tax=Colletotrichum tofieldiae TaxID=708197 RepID=A0A166Y3R7_9PEZI|nr:tyrosine-protein phosphatase non-receptor type 6 [Colletotrichum tofieldiae]
MGDHQPYVTIRSRRPADGNSVSSADSTVGARVSTHQSRRVQVNSQAGLAQYGSSSGDAPRTATHDVSRVSYHVKHLDSFAQTLEDSANRAFPNRGRSSQRYKKVQALLLHWGCDDLFVLPELEDLERCLREDYAFNTEIFPIPSESSHLELMMQVGKLIKDHEAQDTLFLVYYGGHARIDESRQSTWCATRHPDSPWLQWSAIQTLLERSASDVLILLDCCAGAASATFPNGNSITETISASSWDAIAPDPGRYSFTNALIEVMQEWRLRAFSAAMLHAEVLARLKHPRPVTINGKLFEARSTPVHFMMTSNHKAPSIELSRVVPAEKRPPSPPQETSAAADGSEVSEGVTGGRGPGALISGEPNEDTPHVMISLALEDDQQLDLNAWEQWLSNFPAMAKYVKVQGVFKSHSTLLLVSMPVMVWDLLPEDHATSFVAFIRSNNLMAQKTQKEASIQVPASRGSRAVPDRTQPDSASSNTFFSDTTYTYAPTETGSVIGQHGAGLRSFSLSDGLASGRDMEGQLAGTGSSIASSSSSPLGGNSRPLRSANSAASLGTLPRQLTSSSQASSEAVISRTMIPNQQRSARRTVFHDMPEPPRFSQHVETLLQQYYRQEPLPNDDQKNFVASNLGVELWHVDAWFHHRRERDIVSQQFQRIKMDDLAPSASQGAQMILPHHLNQIIEILPPSRILLLDLRPPTDYERSHIRGAINLRAPLGFVRDASFDMIERAFSDHDSRQKFGEWQSTICMVFYARAADSPWECPPADVLYGKFRSWGWPGRCFVLKGHYREFSVSYSKSIAGSKVTGEARVYAEALLRDGNQTSTPSGGDDAARRAQYEVLLTQIDSEGRVNPSSSPHPSASSDRAGAMSQHERDLEAEFRRRVPDLYRKALDVQGSHRGAAAETPPAAPGAGTQTATAASGEASTGHTKAARWDGSSTGHPVGRGGGEDKGGGGDGDGTTAFGLDTKAPLVEHLDRGLSYIRQGRPADASVDASPAASPDNTTAAAANTPAGLSKLAAEGCHAYFDSGAAVSSPSDDSYVKIARGDALQAGDHPPISSPSSFPPGPGHHHHQDHHGGLGGKDGTRDAAAVGGPSGDETPKRGRGGFLNKVLRRA